MVYAGGGGKHEGAILLLLKRNTWLVPPTGVHSTGSV